MSESADLAGPTKTSALRERFSAALMPTYGVPSIALSRGEGAWVWDVDGERYLDMIAGIAVSALGHAHPALVQAVSGQVSALAHTSNLFLHEGEVRLAERLLELLGHDGRVFFTNSGTEANEAALKLAKRAAGPGRDYVVAADSGFHGRTMGSLSLTGKAAIREPFAPFGLDVRFVPYGDADALREQVTSECAAVFVEPVQGEAGVVPPPPGYLRAVREITSASGAAFVLDEIQSGIGRTGHWFAHQREKVVPDVLTLAKGLGGGLPIGACVGLGRYGTAFAKGEHGSTFGGNPVAAAAALAVLDTIERDDLLTNVRNLGALLDNAVRALHHPLVDRVRGAGLWRGLALNAPVAAEFQAAAARRGVLVNAVAPHTVRIAPPLTLAQEDLNFFLDELPAVLDTAYAPSQGEANV